LLYFAFHSAGLSDAVAAALQADLGLVSFVAADDSGVAFESADLADRIARLPYLRNCFEVLARAPRRDLDQVGSDLIQRLRAGRFPSPRPGSGFRIMAHIDGTLIGIAPQTRQRLEKAIALSIGGRAEPRGGGTEYWIIGRRDIPDVFLGRRLPRPAQAKPAPGQLAAELAALVVRVGGCDADDVVLDPFGGSGALLRARAALPHRRLIYSDLDLKVHSAALGDLRRQPDSLVLGEDATALPSLESGSVTRIITDPPWGEFESELGPYEEFAEAVWKSFDRVLRPDNSRATMLIGRRPSKLMIHAALARGFVITSSYDLLVNGHPATLFVAGR
jgi:hypothetical protein